MAGLTYSKLYNNIELQRSEVLLIYDKLYNNPHTGPSIRFVEFLLKSSTTYFVVSFFIFAYLTITFFPRGNVSIDDNYSLSVQYINELDREYGYVNLLTNSGVTNTNEIDFRLKNINNIEKSMHETPITKSLNNKLQRVKSQYLMLKNSMFSQNNIGKSAILTSK